MKQKILLLLGAFICVAAALAQKTAMYAITGTEKGKNGWSEVRLVDYNTGNEVKSVYRNNQEIELLNARTGKPVVVQNTEQAARMQAGKPFATTSAACAYDKKHDRLYYTPMGINELRYIDMKSRTPKIYYFQDEAFGPLKAPRDIPNQITRMVIASNGNGYALTNDAHHLIQFTTSKRPVITDLGSITDAPSNTVSIHNGGGYGGDMVADTKENLYLVTANRHVFKISIETRVAEYLGQIKGLPRGFTTNGAAVEEGTKVIVCSSNSTSGYYRFDVKTLAAEKITSEPAVFNASDLSNGILISEKKSKKEKEKQEVKQETNPVTKEETGIVQEQRTMTQQPKVGRISVYPNPVTNGIFRISFEDQQPGRYQVHFMDVAGKVISTSNTTITGRSQVAEFRIPELITGGNYLVQVVNLQTQEVITNKVVVQ